jgi:predicted DNA-binding transcriptional regulator YafY
MLQTSARLLRLLSLLQVRRFWAGPELAERLEVTARTLRRDVDRLRALGYPVNAASGPAGGYQLGAGAALPPLLLDDDEALAVALGLRTAASGTVTGMEEAALRALAKLEQVLPARLRRRVNALGAAVVPLHHAGPMVDLGLLSAIAGACRGQQEIDFRYADGRARETERSVEPHGLVHTGRRWYLVAWDVRREDFRTFRVDRITSDVSSGRRFLPRPLPDGDLASYVSRSVSVQPYTYQARIVLHATLDAMAERISPMTGRLKRLDAERCLLETGAHSLGGLGLHLAMLGVDFEVQEPVELTEQLRVLAGRLARASKTAAKPRKKTGRRAASAPKSV